MGAKMPCFMGGRSLAVVHFEQPIVKTLGVEAPPPPSTLVHFTRTQCNVAPPTIATHVQLIICRTPGSSSRGFWLFQRTIFSVSLRKIPVLNDGYLGNWRPSYKKNEDIDSL